MKAKKDVEQQQQAERPIARKTLLVKPTAPEPDIDFNEYKRSKKSRSVDWEWFLSTSLPKIADSDRHCESDYMDLCRIEKDGKTVGIGSVMWLDFADEEGVSWEKASKCGYLEVFVEVELGGIFLKKSFILSSERYYKCLPKDFKEIYGKPLANALSRRGDAFPATKPDMATWLLQQGA